MNVLALDIGLRRTGVAFADVSTGVPVALDTIHHKSFDELFLRIKKILEDKKVNHMVLGLPLLPSGDEGEQCEHVRNFANLLENVITYSTVDERYTSFSNREVDSDASAAVHILQTYLDCSEK
ncbi:MAG: Holliday junction resolvase RuvX [Candidatus Peribacteraceae bacterium]|nr:Holliday junction resolvase RuvX [Candidatus Peribacteraceae bacterium]